MLSVYLYTDGMYIRLDDDITGSLFPKIFPKPLLCALLLRRAPCEQTTTQLNSGFIFFRPVRNK